MAIKSTARGRYSKYAIVIFWPFLAILFTFVDYVFQRTPPTPLSQFLRNSLRWFKSPQQLKVTKRSSKSQRAWPGRSHELRCFATKLHTVITSVYIVWYDQNCSRLMRVPPWTRLHCDIDSQSERHLLAAANVAFLHFQAHSKRWQCSCWTSRDRVGGHNTARRSQHSRVAWVPEFCGF